MACKIEGCTNIGKLDKGKRIFVLGYCLIHYQKFKKYGDPLKRIIAMNEGRCKDNRQRIYGNMITRCYNQNVKSFKHYGGRGIKVCERWLGIDGFANFISDMGVRESGMTIDRKEVNGDYTPDNCRWATMQQQQCNRSNNNPVPGVHFNKSVNLWQATMINKGQHYYFGGFKDYNDAVNARLAGERLHLEF